MAGWSEREQGCQCRGEREGRSWEQDPGRLGRKRGKARNSGRNEMSLSSNEAGFQGGKRIGHGKARGVEGTLATIDRTALPHGKAFKEDRGDGVGSIAACSKAKRAVEMGEAEKSGSGGRY
jgi:hypothetical protein